MAPSLRTLPWALFLGACLASPALAQPIVGDALEEWAEDLDRPLARALAYERRDVVAEMLSQPSSLRAADAALLAREIGIPLADARTLVEAARARGTLGSAVADLIAVKVPQGLNLSQAQLMRGSVSELVSAGLSEAQARELARFRGSARRASLHFREVRAIAEARATGAAGARAAGAEVATLKTRVESLARSLGLQAEPASASASKAELARLRAEVASLRTQAGDRLGEFRRVDGSLDWNRLGKSEAMRGAGGVAHFAFALFLKELALVLRTGDRARLETFVDGLLTTDFFVNYGLFAVGARTADVAYGRYVRRLTRKRFVNGVLRSNLVLAAGLAVPMAVRGEFELDTYVVDVAALGLSATAVKSGVEGTKGVYRLVSGGRTALRVSRLGRLATPAGWVYTAGETAVVLLLGDHLANRFDAALTERELRARIKGAEGQLGALLGRLERNESILPAELERVVGGIERAYDDLRRLRLMPLDARIRAFRRELTKAGEKILEGEVAVSALEDRLAAHPVLAERLRERFGSTEAYLERVRRARSAGAEERVRAAAEGFEAEFEGGLERAYRGEGGGAAPAPRSRLASYDDETSLLLAALDRTQDPEARRHIVLAIERVRLGRAMDHDVLGASKPAPATPPSEGLVGALPN